LQDAVFEKHFFNSNRETMCKMFVLLTWIVFFQEIPVFVQVSSRCLLEAKGADLHLEKPMLEDVFLSKTNSVPPEKQCV
jgi:hypothetical protein